MTDSAVQGQFELAPTPTPQTYRVEFIDVGRFKRSWSTTLHGEISEAILERHVRKSRALMSNDAECVFDPDRNGGMVCAGYGPVGLFKVTKL